MRELFSFCSQSLSRCCTWKRARSKKPQAAKSASFKSTADASLEDICVDHLSEAGSEQKPVEEPYMPPQSVTSMEMNEESVDVVPPTSVKSYRDDARCLCQEGADHTPEARAIRSKKEKELEKVMLRYGTVAFLLDTIIYMVGTALYIYYVVVWVFSGASGEIYRQTVPWWNSTGIDDYVLEHQTIANNFTCTFGMWHYCPDYGTGETSNPTSPSKGNPVHGYAHNATNSGRI